MTNFNTMCFTRKNEPGKRDAICLCKKCRMERALNKASPEEIAEKRRVKAIEIIKTWKHKGD